MLDDDESQHLHVHDLPQLYTRPTANQLLFALQSLAVKPSNFAENATSPRDGSAPGIARYLTQIVASPLSWLDEASRETLWELASTRLAERSGRSAAPAMTREFKVDEELTVTLHEPSLTGDNLGLKTWSSSLVLAKKLTDLAHLLPSLLSQSELRVLELGAGTGLVGIAAACKWSTQGHTVHVILSDLPEIVPNLERNVQSNRRLVESFQGRMTVCALDWADERNRPGEDAEKYPIIVAADPLYSPDHPKLLVATVGRWLARDPEARFVVAVPLRDGYGNERMDMKERLLELGLTIEQEGEENGYDDWEGAAGQRQEVKYSWSVWRGIAKWCLSETSTSEEAKEATGT